MGLRLHSLPRLRTIALRLHFGQNDSADARRERRIRWEVVRNFTQQILFLDLESFWNFLEKKRPHPRCPVKDGESAAEVN